MKKRFTEKQIIGSLREAGAGMPVGELCRKHAFSEASYYLWRSQLRNNFCVHDSLPVGFLCSAQENDILVMSEINFNEVF